MKTKILSHETLEIETITFPIFDETAQTLPDSMNYFHALTSLKLCLTVARVFLQALFLVDDDVLDVLHGQMVAEGVEQDVFQLLQGDLLHVELQGRDERRGLKNGQTILFSHLGGPVMLIQVFI